MMRLSELRKRGVIPAKRHDAFLLSLLLAVLTNVAVFAFQALLPKIALLFTLMGVTPAPRPLEAEKQLPFVLIDAASLDEEVRSDLPADAVGLVDREARQTVETPDLPEGTAYIPEGVDMILTAPEGNPGPIVPPGNAPEDAHQPEPAQPARPETPPAEAVAPQEATPPEPEIQAEPPPAPEPPPEPEQSPSPEPEPQPEPVAAEPPAPQAEMPETPPESVEANPPEPAPETIPEPPTDTPPEDDPQAATQPERPVAERPNEILNDMVDLAALPISPDGFIDESTRELERLARQPMERPEPVPERRPRPEQARETPRPEPRSAPQPARRASEPRESAPAQPDRPQPVFKKIGGESGPSGAPPRKSTQTSVRLIGEDASMRILQHRYAAYMAKVAKQLQESLNRQMIMSPIMYSTGQIKIKFGIAPDGKLSHFETIYVRNGMEAERIMSEHMLQEAAPFDPLTPEMQKDENFQNMTVVVNLL